ncbi:hypothetical protein OROMI_009123 [Orobanche minor]
MCPWMTALVLISKSSRRKVAPFLFMYVPVDDGVSFGKQISSPQYEAVNPSNETKLIRIRVQWIWLVPRNDNPDDFYSMQMILCDEENTKIQASVLRAQIGKISQTMKEGFLYGLQNYTVGQNMDDFLCTRHPYRLGFHRYTTAKPCPRLEIPRYGFQFVAFEKINKGAMDLKLSVDVIGQMIGAGE